MEPLRATLIAVLRGLWRLFLTLVLLGLWIGFKFIHEVSGGLEEMVRKRLHSQ